MYINSHINALLDSPLLIGIFIVLIMLFCWGLRDLKGSLFNRYGIGLILVGVLASFFPAGESLCINQNLLSNYCELEVSAAFLTLIVISYLLVSVPYSIVYYIKSTKEQLLEKDRARYKEEENERQYESIRLFQEMDDDELEQYFENEMAGSKNKEKESH